MASFRAALQTDQGPRDLQAQIGQFMRRAAAVLDSGESLAEHLKMRLQRTEFTAGVEDGIGGGIRQTAGEGVE